MPQMKLTEVSSTVDTNSTDSSIFDMDNPKSRNTDASWSALSGATSSSSVFSAVSGDGPPAELIARGTSGSQVQQQAHTSSSPYSLIPSLMELSANEKINAIELRSELQGFMNKVMDMEKKLQGLKKTLSNKQKYINTLECNLKRIETSNSGLRSEVFILSKDNEVLRSKLYEPEVAGTSSPTKRREMVVSPAPSEREVQLGSELDRVLQENANLKHKIEGLEEQLSQTIQQLDHTRTRHEQRRQDVELLLMQASRELENVEAERDETQRLLTEVLNRGTAANKDEGVKTQFESILTRPKPSLTVTELTSIKDRLLAAYKQIDVLEADFREEHEQRLNAERDLARMKATVRDLERDCDTLRLQIQFLQEDFITEREDKKALERNLKANKEMTYHTRISNERGASGGRYNVQMAQIVDHSGVRQVIDYTHSSSQNRNRYYSNLPSDIDCDSTNQAAITDKNLKENN